MNAKRILIAEVNWLGDALFTTPFIRAVRNNFPKAYIACMAVPGVKDVLDGNPNINQIITYDEKNLKKYNFDTVFLLHRSFSRALKMFLAGIPNRVGYYTFKRALLLTERPKPPDVPSVHRAEFYLGLARAAGLETDDKGCDFFIGDEDLKWAGDFVKAERPFVFNPGGNWLPKRWPAENFSALGKLFLLNHAGAGIIITGALKDLPLAERINKELNGKAVIACGKANLKQTAAIFKKSGLVISNDSGPLHIAVSVGASAIGIYGPTSPFITGPYKADTKKVMVLYKKNNCNIPCYNDKCENFRCMSDITPQEVFEAALSLMSNQNTPEVKYVNPSL